MRVGMTTGKAVVSPFAQQLKSHEGEQQDAEHEEQEDVEDLRKSVPDAPERSTELNIIKHTNSTLCSSSQETHVLPRHSHKLMRRSGTSSQEKQSSQRL